MLLVHVRLNDLYLCLCNCLKENKMLVQLIRTARKRVHYGCTKELLPLMVPDIEEINGVLKAEKLFQNGIKNVNDLLRVYHEELSELLRISQNEARKAVHRAKI